MMQNQGGLAVPVEPLSLFAREAAAVGHVHLPVDEDGVARQVYLREGQDPLWWNHFGVDLLRLGGHAIGFVVQRLFLAVLVIHGATLYGGVTETCYAPPLSAS